MNYSDDWLTILEGDCREVTATMDPESVHCVVTSPPYWGLRDYGTATWLGGDEGCDHSVGGQVAQTKHPAEGHSTGQRPGLDASRCRRCGAIRQDSQLGLEPTPEAYVESMVAVFREVRRVLRADGTVWLNLGDSYNTQQAGNTTPSGFSQTRPSRISGNGDQETVRHGRSLISGLKPKDLVGIPWRVAFALQADGWYLRSDIIWSKPNPMPESVTDRPTKAHEYLFLLSKSPRYYYDADAVREPHDDTSWSRKGAIGGRVQATTNPIERSGDVVMGRALTPGERFYNPAGRNLRSVWTIATQPYPGAHFATFPEKLVEPCILAGTSAKGVCPECGAPWVREVERGELVRDDGSAVKLVDPIKRDASLSAWSRPGGKVETVVPNSHRETRLLGWRPSCAHGLEPVPATILDPFAGSGTVGRVAARLSRRAVLIDLNADYLSQAMKRNQDIPLGLETVG